MITYDFSGRGTQPKYEYLYRCIRADIRTGTMPGDSKLPSKRKLAQHLNVSVSTVEQAYDLLVSEGYVQARPGSGFYVTRGKDEGTYQDSDIAANDEAEEDASIDFSANRCSQNLFPADTWARLMRKTLSERDPDLFETVPFNGLLRLRKAIAAYLYEFKGMKVAPECIVIGAGTEYLYGRLLQLFGDRRCIAIGEYGSMNLFNVSQGKSTLWDYFNVDDLGLCIDELESSPATAIHVSPANHFPTGTVLSPDRQRKLIEWANGKPERYIIEDDYDSELRYSGRPNPPLFTQDDGDKVIYLNTFSKTLVPSLRISYMVLPRTLMEIYRQQLSFFSCTVSSFEQLTLAEFIMGGYFERHIHRLRRYYSKQRAAIINAIEQSPLTSIATLNNMEVGTHLLMHVNTHLTDHEISEAARQRGLRLAMLSDYCVLQTVHNTHYAVINIASVESGRIPEMVDMLIDIFKEDLLRSQNRSN